MATIDVDLHTWETTPAYARLWPTDGTNCDDCGDAVGSIIRESHDGRAIGGWVPFTGDTATGEAWCEECLDMTDDGAVFEGHEREQQFAEAAADRLYDQRADYIYDPMRGQS